MVQSRNSTHQKCHFQHTFSCFGTHSFPKTAYVADLLQNGERAGNKGAICTTRLCAVDGKKTKAKTQQNNLTTSSCLYAFEQAGNLSFRSTAVLDRTRHTVLLSRREHLPDAHRQARLCPFLQTPAETPAAPPNTRESSSRPCTFQAMTQRPLAHLHRP